MTRKEFVLNIVEELKNNPRAVLAGHRIPAAVLQKITDREDVMAKLATVLYSTRYAKKGAKGLKKASNFKISGYKNFAEFNMKAREDVEVFIAGLSEKDQQTFQNKENILTILMLPDDKKSGEETIESEIVAGKSVALTFDSAVRKEYRIPGGVYITVMMGDSVARPAEEKAAARKEKINKKKQSRRTPAKVKAELKSKAKKKLAMLDKKRAELQQEAFRAQKELQQFGAIGQQFGVRGGNPISVVGAMNKYDKMGSQMAANVAALNPEEKKLYDLATKYWKAGKKSLANSIFKELGKPALAEYAKSSAPTTASKVVTARRNAIKNQLRQLTAKNEQLLLDLELAPNINMKKSVRSMISKNNAKIRELRAKLGTYKNISVTGMRNKAAMLKETHAAIEDNIASGMNIRAALNSAIDALDAKAAQKTIIKQQVIQEVANGTPMQFAVQQAIQQQIVEPVVQSSALSKGKSVADIMDMI